MQSSLIFAFFLFSSVILLQSELLQDDLACKDQVLTAVGDSCSGPLSDSDKGETMIDIVLHYSG
jgi:hypothetical protein